VDQVVAVGDRQCPVVVDGAKAGRRAARGLSTQRTEDGVVSLRGRVGAVKPRLGLEAFVASRLADYSQASVRKERGELCRDCPTNCVWAAVGLVVGD